MPLVLLLLALLFVALFAMALMPLALVQRYRIGTTRRAARGWVATINLAGILVTAALFVLGAALTSIWISGALRASAAGLAAGLALGMLGVALTRWERGPRSLHYTPNRWLVLGITLVVTARLIFGVWRTVGAWRAGLDGSALVTSAGIPMSLAAGAVVIGYYLAFWIGVRRRLRRER